MGLTTAERNRNKRERKKRERDKRKKQEEVEKDEKEADKEEIAEDVEVEYVEDTVGAAAANPMPDGVPQQVDEEGIESVLQRFQQRAAVTVVTDDEKAPGASASQDDGDSVDGDDADNKNALSNRKMRELLRPSVADLKRRVKRPDLVEAHDVTSADPDFLIYLKSVPNTVPVPRHWGRKRKYLQGKRGFEKPPFQLPDFIVKTGITALRDTVAADESKMSVKQKNRSRVAPKMGAMDVDYRTLYEAFFKHQSKPKSLTGFGDLYYEGKELETRTAIKPGGPLSKALRDALGMASESSPPPWLMNMQRYGPPPSYPGLKIPGLNAPLPNEHCQYGYHPGGWGKPPVDAFGRPLYGGNPFGKPGKADDDSMLNVTLVTSDGKALARANWGALPNAEFAQVEEVIDVDDDDDEEESSEEEMAESDGEVEEQQTDGTESVLPLPAIIPTTAPGDLRKQPGDETPLVSATPKQLYQVLDQTKADSSAQAGVVFGSEVSYIVPVATAPTAVPVPEGAESVLSKALPSSLESAKQKRKFDDDDEESEELKKKFKF